MNMKIVLTEDEIENIIKGHFQPEYSVKTVNFYTSLDDDRNPGITTIICEVSVQKRKADKPA